eukprot:TRINITY_DN811_c0_g2_i1.p1 TRINITY_DN811_c0_g2~~TRINITY_DN811_c0_g2_i1.p1  ORF type:complete len:412 (-),score=109.31 TRINITY_DN811_c0_g2_i1:90-1292(-)
MLHSLRRVAPTATSTASRHWGPAGAASASSTISSSSSSFSAVSPSSQQQQQQQQQQQRGMSTYLDTIEGGRSSCSGIVATVFGATGCLGHHVVNGLGRVGSQIVVPYRGEEKAFRRLKVMGDLGQIVPVKFSVRDQESIGKTLARSDVVVNLLGRKWDTRNFSIDEANVESARSIARAAKEAGVEHFVHVSALGVSEDSTSRWAQAKLASEIAVKSEFPEATIVRPAALFGWEDRLLNNMGMVARFWPFTPIPIGAKPVQPLSYENASDAIIAIIERGQESFGKTYGLAGPHQYTYEQLQDLVIEEARLEVYKVPVPIALMQTIAKYIQNVRKPRFTVDELKMWADGSVVPESNADGVVVDRDGTELLTLDSLNIKPHSVPEKSVQYLREYRKPDFINVL